MSACDLRDAFNAVSLPQGMRCTAARVTYCDLAGTSSGPRNCQIASFDVVKPADKTSATVATQPIPPGGDLLSAVRALAQKTIAGSP